MLDQTAALPGDRHHRGRGIRATRPSQLAGMVEDWPRDHVGEEYSPSAIAKALGRSSGAVANTLDKLVADEYAVQTQDKPKRFTAKASVDLDAQN